MRNNNSAVKMAFGAHYELCPHMNEILTKLLQDVSSSLNLDDAQNESIRHLFTQAEDDIRVHTSSMRNAMIDLANTHLDDMDEVTNHYEDVISDLNYEIEKMESEIYDLQIDMLTAR